jgi:hypothetical protein
MVRRTNPHPVRCAPLERHRVVGLGVYKHLALWSQNIAWLRAAALSAGGDFHASSVSHSHFPERRRSRSVGSNFGPLNLAALNF